MLFKIGKSAAIFIMFRLLIICISSTNEAKLYTLPSSFSAPIISLIDLLLSNFAGLSKHSPLNSSSSGTWLLKLQKYINALYTNSSLNATSLDIRFCLVFLGSYNCGAYVSKSILANILLYNAT